MADKITKARLDHLVEILIQETNGTIDYSLDSAYGGYRLVCNHESQDVSPRMGKTELYHWIHAYRQGIQIGKEVGE